MRQNYMKFDQNQKVGVSYYPTYFDSQAGIHHNLVSNHGQNCDIHAEQKISFINETKQYEICPNLKGWFELIFYPLSFSSGN